MAPSNTASRSKATPREQATPQSQATGGHARTRSQTKALQQNDLKHTNAAKEKHDALKKNVEKAVTTFNEGDENVKEAIRNQVTERHMNRPDNMDIDEDKENHASPGEEGQGSPRKQLADAAAALSLPSDTNDAGTGKASADDLSAQAVAKKKQAVDAETAKRDQIAKDLMKVKKACENGDKTREQEIVSLTQSYESQRDVVATAQREYEQLLLSYNPEDDSDPGAVPVGRELASTASQDLNRRGTSGDDDSSQSKATDVYAVPDGSSASVAEGVFVLRFIYCFGNVYDAYQCGPDGQETYKIKFVKKSSKDKEQLAIPYGERAETQKGPLREVKGVMCLPFKGMSLAQTMAPRNWKTKSDMWRRPTMRLLVPWQTKEGCVDSWEKRTTVEKYWKNAARGSTRGKRTVAVKQEATIGQTTVLSPGEEIPKLDYAIVMAACRQEENYRLWATQQATKRLATRPSSRDEQGTGPRQPGAIKSEGEEEL